MTKKNDKKQPETDITSSSENEMTEDTTQESAPPEKEVNSDDQEPSANRISILEEENRDCQDKLMRLAAEFENYKKRMIRERATSLKYAEENILRELLPSIDNLERALSLEQMDLPAMQEGVELTLKGLLTTVNKFGIEPLDCVGQPFDPNFHEALVMENSTDVAAQHIIREFEKGYQYKERLLRAAKVVVSKGNE